MLPLKKFIVDHAGVYFSCKDLDGECLYSHCGRTVLNIVEECAVLVTHQLYLLTCESSSLFGAFAFHLCAVEKKQPGVLLFNSSVQAEGDYRVVTLVRCGVLLFSHISHVYIIISSSHSKHRIMCKDVLVEHFDLHLLGLSISISS